MILTRMRCHSVVLAFASSRDYGVHKADATTVAACTQRTHEASAADPHSARDSIISTNANHAAYRSSFAADVLL